MAEQPAITQLGRFRILSELGRGAMGVVYEAHDPALDRTVAIKTIVLSGDTAERAGYEARFLQEAKAAGKLSHPAIITIYDVGREGDLAYIAMERLHGTDLRQQMAQGRPPARAAVSIAAQVAEGLEYAHANGVVHRDIKPANIMLLKAGRVKLLDFGIARLQASDVKTQTGVLLGTPKYMSPEQLAGRKLDHRSDIFSLGAVFYEMLTGRTPFSGTDVSQLMHNIAQAQPVAPTRVVPALPSVVDLIVARALEKDPAVRYQSAQEFAADLRSAIDELPAIPVVHGGGARAPAPAETFVATEKLLAPAGAAAAMSPMERTIVNTSGAAVAFCPLSRRFDSSRAMQRLAEPSAKDRGLLGAAPRRPSALKRVLRDPDLRLFSLAMLTALLAAITIVLR